MDKIQLHEIIGYLPYSLVVCIGNSIIPRNLTALSGDSDFAFVTKHIGSREKEMKEVRFIKPILRPLSELTKEQKAMLSEYDQAQLGNFLYENNKFNVCLLERITYSASNFLLKHHFDIHGLINRGLAIDINTIGKEATDA